MQKSIFLCVLIVSLCFSINKVVAQQANFDVPKMKKLIQSYNNQLGLAIGRNNDLKVIKKFYTKDAKLFMPYYPKVVTGIDKVMTYWERVMKKIPAMKVTTISVGGTKEVVFEEGLVESVNKFPNGKTATYKGKYLVVWLLQPDGSYKIAADCWNSNQMPRRPSKNNKKSN